jgi:hypothetical protein
MRFRRKSRSARTSHRSFFRMKRRGHRKSGGGMGGDITLIGGAMAYGAGREWLSNKLAPVTNQVAGVAGQYADEVVLGAIGYLAMKGKIPVINKWGVTKDIGRAMVVIEAARIGQGALGMMVPATSTSGTQTYTYG